MRSPSCRAFPALCVVVAAAGCRDTTGPADGLRVTTSVDLADIRAGQTATVTTTVLNAGLHTRHVYGYQVCGDPFTLTTPDGAVVRTAPDPCYFLAIAVSPTPLAPGKQLVFTGRVSGDVRALTVSSTRIVVVPAGEYVLRGFVTATGSDRAVPVTAPPVTIRVSP